MSSAWKKRPDMVYGQRKQRDDGVDKKDGLQRRAAVRGFRQVDIVDFAKKELERLKQDDAAQQVDAWQPDTIWDCFDKAGLVRPTWLQPFLSELQKLGSDVVNLALSTPPQHGKTTSILVALAWLLMTFPGKRHAYVTYNQSRSNDVYKDFQALLDKLGVAYVASGGIIKRKDGGSVRFTSVDGTLTGQTLDGLAIVDDPVKNDAEAQSPTRRENAWRFFTQSLQTREFKGLSIVVIMTRWHPDDLVGRLIKQGWPFVNLTAICDDVDDPLGRQPGEALWPDAHPVEELARKQQSDPRSFAAMYQGDPTPDGVMQFKQETMRGGFFPQERWVTYGLDAAYSKSRKSDRSCCVRLVTDPRSRMTQVSKVVLHQGSMRDFAEKVRDMQLAVPGPCFWDGSGIEIHAVSDLLRERGVQRLEVRYAKLSKRARAQDCADAWNAGQLFMPDVQDSQMKMFVEEVTRFTGNMQDHDDCVDALSAGYRSVKDRLGRGGFDSSMLLPQRIQSISRTNRDSPFMSSQAYEAQLLARQTSGQRWGRTGRAL